MRNEVVRKTFGMGYVKIVVSMATPYMILGNWGKSKYRALLFLEHYN